MFASFGRFFPCLVPLTTLLTYALAGLAVAKQAHFPPLPSRQISALPKLQSVTLLTFSLQIPWLKAILYCIAQLLGSTFGTLCSAWMSPDMTNFWGGKIGCLGNGVFEPRPNVGPFQVFFWEFGMTFILVSTIIACCVNVPNWGNVSPLIIGISIFSTVVAGGNYTGGAVNPARFFSASIVYGCSLDKIHLCVHALPLIIVGQLALRHPPFHMLSLLPSNCYFKSFVLTLPSPGLGTGPASSSVACLLAGYSTASLTTDASTSFLYPHSPVQSAKINALNYLFHMPQFSFLDKRPPRPSQPVSPRLLFLLS